MLSLLLALAACPIVLGILTGCCCQPTNCSGANDGDCCEDTLPTSLDVTLPDLWSNGDGPCTNCPSIAGTYTLTNFTTANNFCSCFGGSGLTSVGNRWVYESSAFCQGDCNNVAAACAPFDFRLQVLCMITCDGTPGVCHIRVQVALIGDIPCASLPASGSTCCDLWEFDKTFSAGTDCDTKVWELDYVSGNDVHNTLGCGRSDYQCVFTEGDPVTVQA